MVTKRDEEQSEVEERDQDLGYSLELLSVI